MTTAANTVTLRITQLMAASTHLPRISSNSAIPLWCSVSYINLQRETHWLFLSNTVHVGHIEHSQGSLTVRIFIKWNISVYITTLLYCFVDPYKDIICCDNKSWSQLLIALLYRTYHLQNIAIIRIIYSGSKWYRHSQYLPIKYIVDLFPNVCSQPEEFAVYPMQYCLEEIPFSWVLAVEKFQQLKGRCWYIYLN